MKYIITLFLAFLVCTFFVAMAYLSGESINLIQLTSSFIFGILFMPLVIMRLPIFRGHYIKSIYIFESETNEFASRKAAPVMCAIVAALTLAGIFYLLGAENYWFPCFVGGIAAGSISFYYEP